MARESDPSLSDNSRFRVWNASGDLYSHSELAENWDTVDAIIGRPTDGSVWPPLDERGSGGGIYKYLQDLTASQAGVGSVRLMWWPSSAGDIADFLPDKWAWMNGQTIAAANHDWPVDEDVTLIDTRNMFVIGADPAKGMGTTGDNTDDHDDAPGVTQSVGGLNVGGGGSNTSSHTHTVPQHVHQVPAHLHSIAAHWHDMDHRHALEDDGSTTTTGTIARTVGAIELTTGAVKKRWAFPGSVSFGTLGYDPDGTWNSYVPPVDWTGVSGFSSNRPIVPHFVHTHYPRANAGQPKVPSYPAASDARTTTGSATLSTSTQAATNTALNDAFSTGSATTDNRPAHIGLVFLVKIKN